MRALKKPPTRVWLNFYPGWGFGEAVYFSRRQALRYLAEGLSPGAGPIEFTAVKTSKTPKRTINKAKRKKDGSS